ncbi:sec14 cytosolic factor-like isoform X2 [Apium graveolens]|uniref:CRAL-TRIO domain-containing protein n=1 Tax=Apium graveolens TaxID=4045 RepID=A0A6L5B8Y9_APIGR|nr:hypothetical protein AG4045_029842 [Apium graveolens]
MDDKHELTLTQFRDSVEKLGSSTVNCEEPTLMRFLIARSMDPNKAAKMFVQWQKWRTSFVPSGFIPDSQVPDELEAQKVYLQGLSRDGSPVVLIKGNKHFPPKDIPQFKKFVVHMLDKSIASGFREKEIGNEKLMGIIDLQKMSYKNIDARGLITGFQILQSYYPERLGKCFIINMPWFFVSVWKLVSHFLDKATLEKIVVVSNEDEKKEIIEEIGEEVLPEEYGGRAKLVPLQDAVLNAIGEGRELTTSA